LWTAADIGRDIGLGGDTFSKSPVAASSRTTPRSFPGYRSSYSYDTTDGVISILRIPTSRMLTVEAYRGGGTRYWSLEEVFMIVTMLKQCRELALGLAIGAAFTGIALRHDAAAQSPRTAVCFSAVNDKMVEWITTELAAGKTSVVGGGVHFLLLLRVVGHRLASVPHLTSGVTPCGSAR
jgi:hypothetical protein